MSSAQVILNDILKDLDKSRVSSLLDIFSVIGERLRDVDTDLETIVSSLAKNKKTITLNKKTNVYLAIVNKAIKNLDLDISEELVLKKQAFTAFKTQQISAQADLINLHTNTAEAENYKRFLLKKLQTTQDSVFNSYDNFEKLLDAVEDIYLSGKSFKVVKQDIDKDILATITTNGITVPQITKFLNTKTINNLLLAEGIDFYTNIESKLDNAFDGLKGKSSKYKDINAKSSTISPKELVKVRKSIKELKAKNKDTIDRIPMPIVDLASVINTYLHDYIKDRMADPSSPISKDYLRYQSGRFADSASVESASMFGITYDYMHYPYDTFEPGRGTRKLDSVGRSPTRYVEGSIRKIIRDKVLKELYGAPIKEL